VTRPAIATRARLCTVGRAEQRAARVPTWWATRVWSIRDAAVPYELQYALRLPGAFDAVVGRGHRPLVRGRRRTTAAGARVLRVINERHEARGAACLSLALRRADGRDQSLAI